MSRIYLGLCRISWGLGVVSLIAGLTIRFVPGWQDRFGFSPRAGLILAGVLFLCSLASRAIEGAPTRAE
jgi:hypothetical protein